MQALLEVKTLLWATEEFELFEDEQHGQPMSLTFGSLP